MQQMSKTNFHKLLLSMYPGNLTTSNTTELIEHHARNLEEWKNNDSYATYFSLSPYSGTLDPAFIVSINVHWMQFNPPHEWEHHILAIILSCIMVIGLVGNALVICMCMRNRALRTSANTLVINLAVSDFFMLAKTPIHIYNCLEYGPALGDYACRIYGFVGGLTGTASITTLTAISLDRYFVIIYPLNPAILNSKRLRSIIMIIFVWNYSFLFSIIPALDIGLSRYTPEGFLTSCSFDYLDRHTSARIFMFAFFVSAWVIPLSIIVYCYARILNAVNKTDVPMWSNRMRNQIEHKLIAVVIKVIVLWFLAWTPYAIVALLGITGNEQYLTPWTSMIPALFCKTAACINPYLYSMTHPHFRREISRYLYTWFGIGSAPAVTTTSYPMSVRYGTYRASHTTAK